MKSLSFKQILISLSAFFGALVVSAHLAWADAPAPEAVSSTPYKVYVMLGFHVDFYHSYRGDDPDESGYGYDDRIISASIRTLNAAQAAGKKAKAYWDFSGDNWTFDEFVPKNFPALIDGWKSRDPHDEFIVGPFNNGLTSASTKAEFMHSIAWTLNNPKGYGLEQIFHNVGHFYRPQEMFFGSGQVNWLHDAGMQGLILQYATFSFDAFADFISPLATSDRFNPIWFKSHETDEPIVVLPAMSPIDLVNFTSLEALMISLRQQQLSGQIKRNVVIHINMDADAMSWLPMVNSKLVQDMFPGLGGLQEILNVVNKYDWSDFTTPSEYLKLEQPRKTVLVTQDMADGAFGGMASWAEKHTTQTAWTRIEQTRTLERFLNAHTPALANRDAWTDAGFFNRVMALSTTHFGMSVPVVHYRRLQRLTSYVGAALTQRTQDFWSWFKPSMHLSADPQILVGEYPRYGQTAFTPSLSSERISLLIPKNSLLVPVGMPYVRRGFDQDQDALDIFKSEPKEEWSKIQLASGPAASSCAKATSELNGGGLHVSFSKQNGIDALTLDGQAFGDSHFLAPFVSYKEKTSLRANHAAGKSSLLSPMGYELGTSTCSSAPMIQEVDLNAAIKIQGPSAAYSLPLNYRFWTDSIHPNLYVDVHADVPYTIDETAPLQADLRYIQLVDWRWQEIALSQLKPLLGATKKIHVWKMNYEGLVSTFTLNQEEINPKNKDLDSSNNHVTPGWMAVSDGEKGMLIAFNAMKLASFGAVPLRLSTLDDGEKTVALNPFGTYWGQQLDYSHVGGEKLGSVLANAAANYLQPSAPSFMGQSLDYQLMIIPYHGDRPTDEMIKAALNFAYPAIAVLSIPQKNLLETNLEQNDRNLEQDESASASAEPLAAPQGLAAAALNEKIAVSWRPTHSKIGGIQLLWRELGEEQWHVAIFSGSSTSGLINSVTNGKTYQVYVRAFANGQASALSNMEQVKPTSNVQSSTIGSVTPSLKILSLFMNVMVQQHELKDPDRQK